MEHAIRNPLYIYEGDGYDIFIGGGRDGTLLEVAVNDNGDIFHAMKARRKFLDPIGL